MKGIPALLTLIASLTAGTILLTAATQERQDKKDAKTAVFVSSDEVKYKETAPGAMSGTITGDPDKGAYSRFSKFAPGATFAMHSHPNAMRIVVIKGAYVYKPENGPERRVSAGCYLDLPAGDRHTSSADAKEGALFFEESTGKFDITFVDVKK